MKMSENTADLFCALAQFQCELDNTSKNKQGHGYKYSDLAACINQAKELLGAHGLAVVQCMGHLDGAASLVTMLTHKSGQYIQSEAVLPKAVLMGGGGKNPVQEVGSAITYMRRYNYAAIIGLTQEDDDGKSCGQPRKQQQQQKNQQQVVTLNQQQQDELKKFIEENMFTVGQIIEYFQIKSLAEIPANQLEHTKNTIKGWIQK